MTEPMSDERLQDARVAAKRERDGEALAQCVTDLLTEIDRLRAELAREAKISKAFMQANVDLATWRRSELRAHQIRAEVAESRAGGHQ